MLRLSRKVFQQFKKQITQPLPVSHPPTFSTSPAGVQNSGENLQKPTQQCPFQDKFTKSPVQPFKNIPGPKGLPIVGTLFDYTTKDGLAFSNMHKMVYQHAKEYGPIYYEKIGDYEVVMLSCPESYERIVQAEGKYPRRMRLEALIHYKKERGFDIGVVNSDGEEWYKQRTVISKKMLRLPEVAKFREPMAEVSEDFVARLLSVRSSSGEIPELRDELFKFALESVCVVLFEERFGCLEATPSPWVQSFINDLHGFFGCLGILLYSLPLYKYSWKTKTYKKFERHADAIVKVGSSLVEKKVADAQSGPGSGLLSYLVESGSMNMKEITGLVVDILSAGVESTATTVSWCLYLLAKNPEVQQRFYDEIKGASGADGQPVSAETLCSLPYAKAVLKETFRVRPTFQATSRYISDDLEVAGYHLPGGTHVQANLYGMYRDPAIFDQPEEFRPERWLKSNHLNPAAKNLVSFQWGHGARMCPGRRIAEQEIILVVSKIVQNLELSHPQEDVESVMTLMLTPERPIRLHVTPRQQQ